MPEIGWAGLGIVPEVGSDFGRKLGRDIDPALSRVGGDSGKRFGGIFGKAAVAAAGGLIGAGFAAFKLGQDALGEAREAQEVGRTSAAILKATGGAANLTRKEYDKLTESLMRKTAIDDEQIATGGNLLLTFKNVKREGKGLNDIFGRALSDALDLSAAGFGSIESASVMLGKALNDPVKGVTALGRAGVTFSEEQKAAIKAMVASNDLLGAQKIILREVESQVGGTAEKQKTSAKELEVAWGNVKEEIGFALIPVMNDLANFLLDKGIPAGEDFSKWIRSDGIPAVRDFVDDVKPLAKEVLPVAADALGAIKDAGEKALPIAKDLVSTLNDMPDWAKQALGIGGAGLVVKSKLGGGLFGGKGGKLTDPAYVYVVNGGGAGGGKGKGGLPGLPLIGGTGAGVGLFSLFAGEEQFNSTKAFLSNIDTGSKSKIRDSLDTELGKYADDLGIDLDRLATDLDTFGSKGEYVKQVMRDLDKASNPGLFKDWLDGVNPLSNKVADLGTAFDHIRESFAAIDKQVAERKEVAGLLGAGDPAGKDISSTWDKIPDKKLKLLMDPESENTRKGVREVLENVEGLTKRDYKVLFEVLGLTKARKDSEVLLQNIRELTGLGGGSAAPSGGYNPTKPGGPKTPAVGGPMFVDRVILNAHDPRRTFDELQGIQRRMAIGGYR